MAVDDFDISHRRECMSCHRSGFDNGDWQFVGYDDLAELYICPECVETTRDYSEALQDPPARTSDEAESGDGASTPGIYHECGNCGVPRFSHGSILEACPNCGDDETDLSLIDEVP